ncbi:hypothetical protein [Corynebacterium coyleae]|uniref:hypothetical protein n=1 Tax=Corynebacterium coyleae TaxID=53374 RepID=UPI00254ABB4C|nr:hypothetical protein [Corynebacterium coyleae]MDK8800414.1 hypothetical protein [Corynebacterium coyleae]
MNVRNTTKTPHYQQEHQEHVPSQNLSTENARTTPIRARLSQPVYGWTTTDVTITGHRTRKGSRRVAIHAHMPNGLYIALEIENQHVYNLANSIVDAMEGIGA